jgi:hypothetical protein
VERIDQSGLCDDRGAAQTVVKNRDLEESA